MSQINTADLVIPKDISNSWQININLIGEIMSIPTALIIGTHGQNEVVTSNQNNQSSYNTPNSEGQNKGLCCWLEDAHVKPFSNSKSFWSCVCQSGFCLGLPIKWPNGDLFGTICVFGNDVHLSKYSYQKLVLNFRNSIELQLATLYQKEKLTKKNIELNNKVNTCSHDVNTLNSHLDQEIKRRKFAEEVIRYQQWHDIGTGFLNRPALEKEIKKLTASTENKAQLGAVIHINFKNGLLIQEQTDVAIWQSLLIQFEQKIRKISNHHIITTLSTPVDLVLLVSSLKDQSALDNLCKHIVKSSQSAFKIDEDSFHLNAYIGVCTTDDTSCPSSLLQFAEKVAQSCKDSGHHYRYYSQALPKLSANTQEMESYLLKAIRNNDLLLHFQPKVCTKTHLWIGAEALLRWRHPTMGDISSETLINIAEKNGLIFEIGRFVLNKAVQKAVDWVKWSSEFKIAVNVSVVQLNNLEFVSELEDLLKTHQLPAKNIELEITESGIVIDEAVMEKAPSSVYAA
ncbi:EAL domain-containing protein [Vibrio sp.]|uniref:EAL domain-containing protein n=1 Tax=Vibrio sp. TaxID=678 RepID=UPI00311F4E00